MEESQWATSAGAGIERQAGKLPFRPEFPSYLELIVFTSMNNHRISRASTAIVTAVAALLALLPGLQLARAGIPEPDLIWYGKVLVASGDIAVRATTGILTAARYVPFGTVP